MFWKSIFSLSVIIVISCFNFVAEVSNDNGHKMVGGDFIGPLQACNATGITFSTSTCSGSSMCEGIATNNASFASFESGNNNTIRVFNNPFVCSIAGCNGTSADIETGPNGCVPYGTPYGNNPRIEEYQPGILGGG